MGLRAASVDRLAVLRRSASTSPLSAYSWRVRYTVASPTGSPRRRQDLVDLLGRAEVVDRRRAPRATARRCLVGRGGRNPSVLVIVLSVGRVAVAVVHVVDVVAVLDGQVAAVLAVHVPVRRSWSAMSWPSGAIGANGARSRCRDRSHTPSGHAAANPASDSSTMVGPGATLAQNDAYAASSRPPTDARCRAPWPRRAWSGTTARAVARSRPARPSAPRRAAGRRCASPR